MSPAVPVVCTIGATEPWNAAGIGLDLRALAACGVRAVSVVAGVTAQDRDGVHAASAVAPPLIAAQFAALAHAPIAAYRIGALLDVASVDAVAAYFEELRGRGLRAPIVYDPVLAPSGGGSFADDATVHACAGRVFPLATLVTPNLREAGRFADCAAPLGADDMAHCAHALRGLGAAAVLVTGGDLPGEPRDVLADAAGITLYKSTRLPGTLRGTGCLLACALAAGFARGEPLREAVTRARMFVRERFATAVEIGGMRLAY